MIVIKFKSLKIVAIVKSTCVYKQAFVICFSGIQTGVRLKKRQSYINDHRNRVKVLIFRR